MPPPRRRQAAPAPSRGDAAAVAGERASAHEPQPPDRCDIAVVGAGIVGLAVARELISRYPRACVCVFERESDVGTHQTAHSSGVVHTGVYYAPGSLKARLCTDGARRLRDYCAEHAIAFNECGKVILATRARELA